MFVLRSGTDQTKIKEAIKNAKNIVVVGGGFIGSECTADIKNTFKNQKNVSLICEGVPMERIFGFEVASSILSEHENNGAKVYVGKDVTKLRY
jgi:NAD(P)H-nitrite reductase large subunit